MMVDWNHKYAPEAYVYGEAPNDFLREQVNCLPAGHVAVLADGEGRNGVFLAEQGYRVTSVDRSERGVAKARKLAAKRGTHLDAQVGDLGSWAFPQELAGVVSIYCHVAMPLRRTLHQRAVAALGPGGVLLLEAYTPKQLAYKTGGPPNLDLLMTLDELRADFADLELLHGEELEREVVEGTLHTGLAHVVQFIGRKPSF